MRAATLQRNETSNQGTFGTWESDNGFTCRTCELPWLNNNADDSCIPDGAYIVKWAVSQTKGPCYHICRVPRRSEILIHAANWPCELQGCLAPGLAIEIVNGSIMLMHSRLALDALETSLDRKTFQLTIRNPT
jgi:hypothetical protein